MTVVMWWEGGHWVSGWDKRTSFGVWYLHEVKQPLRLAEGVLHGCIR